MRMRMRRKSKPTCLRDVLWPGATKPVVPLDEHKPYTLPSEVTGKMQKDAWHTVEMTEDWSTVQDDLTGVIVWSSGKRPKRPSLVRRLVSRAINHWRYR